MKHLTAVQVADLLQVDVATLARWRAQESKGPEWVRLEGRAIRYPEAGLARWMTDQKEASIR